MESWVCRVIESYGLAPDATGRHSDRRAEVVVWHAVGDEGETACGRSLDALALPRRKQRKLAHLCEACCEVVPEIESMAGGWVHR
jgi:hypothetical protein